MPVIPVYDQQVELDPDVKGTPRENVSTASDQAAIQGGRALQGLGTELSTVADRAQQQQQEAASFSTGLQERALNQDLSTALKNGINTMLPNGAGFTNQFEQKASEIAQQRFAQMPDGQAKQRAIEAWQAYGLSGWREQAFQQEYKQKGAYSSDQIATMRDTDLSTVQQNPAAADALADQARAQIMNAPGLSADQKTAALADYQRNLYGTQLQTQYGADPDGMREALHMAPPGSPGATFSRMIGAESGGDPNAVSPKGALGVAQLMPDTARDVARDLGITSIAGMSDGQMQAYFAQHPDMNRQLGRAYFGQMLDKFGGDQEAAVIAYNAGPQRAAAWLARGKDDAVLPSETVDYRNKVLGPDYSLTHTVTTASSHIGQVGFDGSAATVNGRTFSAPAPAIQVAKQFEGMDERNNRSTLSAFIEKSCGQKVDPSQIPWCASFADAVLGASGKQTLGSARAADFLNYGSPTNAPSQGDVVVFKSLSAGSSGHVGFVVGIEGDRVRYIAGNDGNKVQEDTLPLSKVAGFRVPPQAGQASPDGGVFNGKYASLTFNDRQKLIAGAEAGQKQAVAAQQQQFKLDTYNTQKLVDDDTASLEATGQGVQNLDANRVGAVLGPKGYQEWQDKRATALDVFKGSSDFSALTNDQLAERVEQLRPGPQDAGENFGRKQTVFDTVQKKATDLLKRRADDPADVVSQMPAVQAARVSVTADHDHGGMQKVVQARMAAQASLGIPDGQQQPITKAEALKIIEPVNNAPAGMDGPAMRTAISQIEAMVGPQYAPRALQFMLNQGKVDNDTSRMLSALLIKAQKNQPVTQTDIQNLNNVSAGAALRNSVFMGSAQPTPPTHPGAPATPTVAPAPAPADAVAVPTQGNLTSLQRAATAKGGQRLVPPNDAIASLVQNPSKAADFDEMFGQGSAAKVLSKWHTMTGAPPNGR